MRKAVKPRTACPFLSPGSDQGVCEVPWMYMDGEREAVKPRYGGRCRCWRFSDTQKLNSLGYLKI
jgi:hypothetical protein